MTKGWQDWGKAMIKQRHQALSKHIGVAIVGALTRVSDTTLLQLPSAVAAAGMTCTCQQAYHMIGVLCGAMCDEQAVHRHVATMVLTGLDQLHTVQLQLQRVLLVAGA